MVEAGRHKSLFFIAVTLALLSLGLGAGFLVQSRPVAMSTLDTEALERAFVLEQEIRQSESGERDYLILLDSYKKVVGKSERSDEALYAMARLSQEMAGKFDKPRYYYNAVDYLKQLARDYPQSPKRAQALLEAARLLEEQLGESEEASSLYREISHNSTPEGTVSASKPSIEPKPLAEKTITGIRSFSGQDYARIVVDLTTPVDYEKPQLHGKRLSLTLHEAALTPELENRILTNNGGLLRQVALERVGSQVKVNFQCEKLQNYAVFTLNNPDRLVIDLNGTSSVEAAEETPLDHREALEARLVEAQRSKNLSLTRALGLKVRKIVIDPGHGGHDTGAISGGLKEKDLVLDIALRLKKLINENLKGIEVVMTREKDTFVALEERTAIANAQKADLFISIHANSSELKEVSGVETYYLSINATKDELAVAARENASTTNSAGDLQNLLQKIVLDDKLIESRNFAHYVQRGLVSGLSVVDKNAGQNRGVKKAPFIVLIGANMPSVLAEVSFMNNPALKTTEFRQTIAESLFAGSRKYIDSLRGSAAK